MTEKFNVVEGGEESSTAERGTSAPEGDPKEVVDLMGGSEPDPLLGGPGNDILPGPAQLPGPDYEHPAAPMLLMASSPARDQVIDELGLTRADPEFFAPGTSPRWEQWRDYYNRSLVDSGGDTDAARDMTRYRMQQDLETDRRMRTRDSDLDYGEPAVKDSTLAEPESSPGREGSPKDPGGAAL